MNSKKINCLLLTNLSQREPENIFLNPLRFKKAFLKAPAKGCFAILHRMFVVFLLTLMAQSVHAQTTQQILESLLSCNTPVNWVSGSGPSVSILNGNMPGHVPLVNVQRWTGNFGVNLASVTGTDNIVDANTTSNFGRFNYLLSVSGGTRVTVQSTTGQIPSGYFAGFMIRNTAILNVNLLGTFTIKTYLNNTLQESIGAGSGLLSASLINSGGKSLLGFVTSKPFNRLMLEQNQTLNLGVAAATEIYNPVIEKFCAETLPLDCNVNQYWKNPAFPVYLNPANTGISNAVACVGCEVRNIGNLIDNDSTNYAEIYMPGSLGASGSVSVKNAKTVYNAGTFAGFEINDRRTAGVAIGITHAVATYLNGVRQDSVTDGGALVTGGLFTSTGKVITGFKTTKNFDEIRFTAMNSLALGATNPIRVYGAIVSNFCAGPALQCNTDTRLRQSSFPVFVDAKNTGIDALACVQCDIVDANNAIDAVADNYTQVVLPAGAATTAAYAVTEGSTIYNTDSAEPVFAGFEIENPGLVGLNALQGISVATTLNGVVQQVVNSANGLVSLRTSLLNGNAHQTVGFIPAGPFDGVKIILNSAVNVNLGTTRIYGVVFKKFCESNLSCNNFTALETPIYPVYINGQHTGVDAVTCVGCSINNTQNIVSGSGSATLTMAATAGASAAVAVANAIETYPVESFAGFDVSSPTLLSANALANVRISLYNNGVEVQSGTGEALLVGAQTSVVNGAASRQVIGIISRVAFDEVQLKIQNVAGADLGEIQIYKAYVQKPCSKATPCNFSRIINGASDGAVIDAAHTGVKGGVCATCQVKDPWNAVTESTEDYARLYNTATALVENSLAVAMPAYTFPSGTFAGFSVRKNNFLVAAGLFQHLTISTYNDGILQESKSGSSLIDLRALLQILGTSNAVYIPGFYATKPFDEVKITTGSLATALDQYVDVYGAYIDTKGDAVALSLGCNITNPDIAVTIIRTPVTGSVEYNDKIQTDPVTYASTITVPEGYTNPSPATPVIQPDGSYSFVADTPGVYQFEVSVCFGEDTSCVKELFTITVVDAVPNGVKSPPVANTDIANTAYNTPAVIHVLANDKPGSPELQLQPSTVAVTDLNGGSASGNTSRGGTAAIDPVTGNITYTPSADFAGTDTIRYTVCDNQPVPECASAYVIVNVLTPTAANSVTAADDFYTITYVSGKPDTLTVNAVNGLLANDSDPEGNSISIVPKDTVIAGMGRLVLAADGSFIFIPEAGFKGTVVIPYDIYDDGSPAAAAGGSIHIMIKALVPDLTPTVTVNPAEMHNTTNVTVMVDIKEINIVPTTGAITVYLVKNKMMPLQLSGSDMQINGIAVQNSLWTVDSTSNAGYYILTTTESISAGGKHTIGFTGVFTPGAATGKVNITSTITKSSGGEENTVNNIHTIPIYYFEN